MRRSTELSIASPSALCRPAELAKTASCTCRASQPRTNNGSSFAHRAATSTTDPLPLPRACRSHPIFALVSSASSAAMADKGAPPDKRKASTQAAPGCSRASQSRATVSGCTAICLRWQRLNMVAGSLPARSARKINTVSPRGYSRAFSRRC